MTQKVKQQIIIQTRTKTAFQQIFTNFQINVNEKNEIIKAKNVYNQKTKFKYETLNNLTSTKTFLKKLSFREQ
jgi:hypothetical protein